MSPDWAWPGNEQNPLRSGIALYRGIYLWSEHRANCTVRNQTLGHHLKRCDRSYFLLFAPPSPLQGPVQPAGGDSFRTSSSHSPSHSSLPLPVPTR